MANTAPVYHPVLLLLNVPKQARCEQNFPPGKLMAKTTFYQAQVSQHNGVEFHTQEATAQAEMCRKEPTFAKWLIRLFADHSTLRTSPFTIPRLS